MPLQNLTAAAATPVHVGQKLRERPEIAIISTVIENGVAIGGLGDGEAVWHSDSSFNAVSPGLSILHSIELPPSGGGLTCTSMDCRWKNPKRCSTMSGRTLPKRNSLGATSGNWVTC